MKPPLKTVLKVLPTAAIAALLLLPLLAGCEGGDAETATPREMMSIPFQKEGTLQFVRNGTPVTAIDIEVADTDSARTRGLMQRTSLPNQSGMLFLFDREEIQSFWMANTPLSLDIFFVNADTQIVRIARYTRPFSAEGIASEAPAQYVIETQAGFADTHGIVEGDRVSWQRLPR